MWKSTSDKHGKEKLQKDQSEKQRLTQTSKTQTNVTKEGNENKNLHSTQKKNGTK